jgi:hypothetical protein
MIKRAVSAVSGVGCVVAGVVLGAAAPAHAENFVQGVYTYHQDGLPPVEWTIYPTCVQTVGDLRVNYELPLGCTIHIASNSSELVNGGDARLTGGLWTFTQPRGDGLTCPDGSKAAITETYAFDDTTWQGTRTITNTEECGGAVQPAMKKVPFTLTFKDPLPIPVDKFPLYCRPDDALRRCS